MNKIAVLDLETDPFAYGEMVYPFLSGFYDGSRCVTFWSPDCVDRLVRALETERETYTIYAHNGGRFDFFYFMDYLHDELRIINGRIVQARMGKHEVRDSFAILPFPLASYDKDKIDYKLFKKDKREKHRDEIMKYFKRDLTALYELVTAFHSEFGDKLTVGSASMKQIKARHQFSTAGEKYDKEWRERFYFGGRNQVFKSGVSKGDIRVYDVNSMYPHVMQSYLHPIGIATYISRHVERDSVFVVAEGKNYGAFPVRKKDGGLDFTKESGTFYTTIHEWNAALDTGCFKPTRLIKTYCWNERGTFEEFVSHFYNERAIAKKTGDKIRALLYKYVLNSGYGKFAQNPENYYDWYITPNGTYPPDYERCSKSCTEPCLIHWLPEWMTNGYTIWKRSLSGKRISWYNIATGASITGAARAVLLRGLSVTSNPIYCDTDSIICCGDSRVPVHATNLGAWDLEATGRMVAVAGKKLYALFADVDKIEKKKLEEIDDDDFLTPEIACIKKAHKGALLTGPEILRITRGETIESENPVPTFRWDKTYSFTKRKIRRTA